jgi:hypothetical protein
MAENPKIEPARRTVKRGTTRADAFLAGLLAGRGISEACEAAGISRSTGLRLRKGEEFQKRFREARTELLTDTLTKLHRDASDFEATLHSISVDTGARGSDRVLAARHGLDLLFRGLETVDFAERIGRLEQVAAKERK